MSKGNCMSRVGRTLAQKEIMWWDFTVLRTPNTPFIGILVKSEVKLSRLYLIMLLRISPNDSKVRYVPWIPVQWLRRNILWLIINSGTSRALVTRLKYMPNLIHSLPWLIGYCCVFLVSWVLRYALWLDVTAPSINMDTFLELEFFWPGLIRTFFCFVSIISFEITLHRANFFRKFYLIT